jgi:transcriptional regulator with XRE-family HTH domain
MTVYPPRGAASGGVVSDAYIKRYLKALGHRVRELRLAQSSSVEDFAQVLGVSVEHLSEVEEGDRDPGVELIHQIAKNSKMRLAEFVEPVESETQRDRVEDSD